MDTEFDPIKRDMTRMTRGLDFARCAEVFAGPVLEIEDKRQNYGEQRMVTFSLLDGRTVVIVWTPRDNIRRMFQAKESQ